MPVKSDQGKQLKMIKSALKQEWDITRFNAIQNKTIQSLIDGNSTQLLAPTGTGKTLAYLIPLIVNLKEWEEQNPDWDEHFQGPWSVIVTPTKELALQVSLVLKRLSHHLKFKTRVLTGGQKGQSIHKEGLDFLVTTPNRLAAISNKLNTKRLSYVVFDEADTLFEMGFVQDILRVKKSFDKVAPTYAMVSATMSQAYSEAILSHFADVTWNNLSLQKSHYFNPLIETFNMYLNKGEKEQALKIFIKKNMKGRGIIFCNQKNQVEKYYEFISQEFSDLKIMSLHGDQSSSTRLKTLKKFRENKGQVLIATDVAARGVDISDLSWVLNFNFPKNSEFYLHRSGRVGRSGKPGKVFNLVTPEDAKAISLINQAIKEQNLINLDLIKLKVKNRTSSSAQKKTAKKKVTKRSDTARRGTKPSRKASSARSGRARTDKTRRGR